MKKLFDYADSYLKKCDWRDLALIKFCLFFHRDYGRSQNTGKAQKECNDSGIGGICCYIYSFDGKVLWRYC